MDPFITRNLDTDIEDAKTRKKTVDIKMESIMSLMREVESREKAAQKAKQEVNDCTLEIMAEINNLILEQQRVKDANDKRAREVCAQKANLATEMNALLYCMSGVLTQGDECLANIDEINKSLEKRLTSAVKQKDDADEEKLNKEATLAYQKNKMKKLVDESKKLEQQERENIKAAIEMALKEAKDKFEKRVEELTWRLQLEKRLRIEIEESKAQETAKLQEALRLIQIQIDEANDKITKECEDARKAMKEAPPVVMKIPVIIQDTKKIDTLTAEVESFKALLLNQKQELEEAKKSLIEAEKRAYEFQESNQRLEEKLSNLESENQVLRQTTLLTPASSNNPRTTIIHETELLTSNSREPEYEEKPHKSFYEKQQENQDILIECITQDLGFSNGKPVAAVLIYKSLLHWRSLEVETTTVFDRIIQTVGSAIEVQDSNDVLGYWLCNTSTLLILLQHTLKASGAAHMTLQRQRLSSASSFGRMSHGLRASPQNEGILYLNGRLDDLPHVEAKHPALLFKLQLTAFLEKIYGMIRDNLKKEISPLLGLCIQAPRKSLASLVKGHSQANAVAQQTLIGHWQSIVKSLDNYLKTMKANFVPPFLVSKVFTQIFSIINVQLFNSLLLRRECCSLSNGKYVKSGLAELEQWCYATEEYAGTAWDELKHIRQGVGFLVIHQKPKMTLNEITNELCPVLSIQQLYRISTMYWDGTHSVSSEVYSSMRIMLTEDSNNAGSSTFLLDDDSSIPFSVDDISTSMSQVEISYIEPPPLFRNNPGFMFLHKRTIGFGLA